MHVTSMHSVSTLLGRTYVNVLVGFLAMETNALVCYVHVTCSWCLMSF